jgi:hypothetical protein
VKVGVVIKRLLQDGARSASREVVLAEIRSAIPFHLKSLAAERRRLGHQPRPDSVQAVRTPAADVWV